MNRHLKYIFFLILSLSACRNSNKESYKQSPDQQEALLRVNKYLVKKDADAIKGYIFRHGWNMTQTKTGLWYQITEKGTGAIAAMGKKIKFTYKVWLLDGTFCYSSDLSGAKTFTIGKGGVEPGLEQGILLMNEGDKARLILPPHLAYGLIGDENKIPARATIVYEIHLLKIEDKQ